MLCCYVGLVTRNYPVTNPCCLDDIAVARSQAMIVTYSSAILMGICQLIIV
jgi:hypothetical protein